MAAAATFKKPVDWDEMYPGRFIKAGELKGKQVTLTIKDIHLEELETDAGKKVKGIVSFEGTTKGLALNKTNGLCIKAMFGKSLPNWYGKKITIFPSTWNGDDCIRIWGSPEIAADMDIVVQLPRKKPIKMTMHRVMPRGAKGSVAPPVAPPPPPPVEDSVSDESEPGFDGFDDNDSSEGEAAQ